MSIVPESGPESNRGESPAEVGSTRVDVQLERQLRLILRVLDEQSEVLALLADR